MVKKDAMDERLTVAEVDLSVSKSIVLYSISGYATVAM